MSFSTLNTIFDFVLIAAAVWMIVIVRGIGGIVGRSLNLIVIGAIVLGIAHLLATLGASVLNLDGGLNNFIHRLIVLAGFVFLVLGFRQVSEMKK